MAHQTDTITTTGERADLLQSLAKSRHFLRMEPGDTLAGILSDYQSAADRTDEVVAGLPDLGVSHLLPEAPWFEKGARWWPAGSCSTS